MTPAAKAHSDADKVLLPRPIARTTTHATAADRDREARLFLALYGVTLRPVEDVLRPAREAYDRATGRATVLPPPPCAVPCREDEQQCEACAAAYAVPEGEEPG